MSIQGPYHCTVNDKNSVKYSQFMSDLKEGKIFKDVSNNIRTGDGENDFITLSNVYVIADGGYLAWGVIIDGFGVSAEPTKYKFTDWVASVRKDVEC
jgi:hypothetical protein